MNTNKTYDIVGGPSRDLLFDGCKYAYDRRSNIDVYFSVATGYTAPPERPDSAYVLMDISELRIAGIEHESGSGESFNLHGYCKLNEKPLATGILLKPYKFKAYYNARTRKGTISFSE